MTQTSINFKVRSRADQMQDHFERFHRANTHIAARFFEIADRIRASGREHYGARAIIEIIRFEQIETKTDDPCKINDHHAPFYARMYERLRDCEGFFRCRRRTSKSQPEDPNDRHFFDSGASDDGDSLDSWFDELLGSTGFIV